MASFWPSQVKNDQTVDPGANTELASMWPSRKTLKNEVKLINPIQQEDDEDIDWLALPITKDDD